MKAQRGSKRRYSSIISLTLVLDEGGWSTPRPGRFTPGNDPVPIVQEVGWAPGPVWTGYDPRNVQPVASCYTD